MVKGTRSGGQSRARRPEARVQVPRATRFVRTRDLGGDPRVFEAASGDERNSTWLAGTGANRTRGVGLRARFDRARSGNGAGARIPPVAVQAFRLPGVSRQ